MNHWLLLTIIAAGLLWGLFRYFKFKSSGNIQKVKTTGKPFIVPSAPVTNPQPEQLAPVVLNRQQRRRMDKAEKAYEKKFAGRKLRDELRSGKIIEANEFLKQYFNDKK